MADVADTELLDYEEEEQTAGGDAAATGDAATANGTNGAGAKDGAKKDAVKGTYVSIHSSGFRDFLLKPEILRAIVDCGFEHPSEGECRNEMSLARDDVVLEWALDQVWVWVGIYGCFN